MGLDVSSLPVPLHLHADVVPFKECEIIIFKGHLVLGLIIAGGTDSLLGGIYIQKIIPGSPADKDGRLKPGDKILKINNSSMEGVTRDEALHALQHSSSFVHITIVRDPNRAPTMPPYKEEGTPFIIWSSMTTLATRFTSNMLCHHWAHISHLLYAALK